MARAVTTRRKIATTAVAWIIGLLIFFPIFWTILTSFKTEAQAINNPPNGAVSQEVADALNAASDRLPVVLVLVSIANKDLGHTRRS